MGISLTNNNQGGYIRVRRTSPGISGAGAWCGYYLLNAYPGAVAAYSLRRLRKEYEGPLARVRRSSDNAETDIGYVFSLDGDVLDEAALLAFVGGGNGFVTTWYDQSGNGVHQARTTANQQPQIITNGALYTSNGKPSLYFNGVMSLRSIINISLTSLLGECSSFGVIQPIVFGGTRVFLSSDGIAGNFIIPAPGQFLRLGSTANPRYQSNTRNASYVSFNDSGPLYNLNQTIMNSIRRSVNIETFANGSTDGPLSLQGNPPQPNTPVPLDIGYRGGIDFEAFQPLGYIQEIIHYPLDASNFYEQTVRSLNTYYKAY